ncbi:MAG: DUF2905 domain-containing protein [Nitrospinae bacterium]|nr:DUF2905 domain-containing protein [Nitrospinota bacterium]MCY4381775.1 DUF2905 domain-containing protein [Nitrospinota bacterium]
MEPFGGFGKALILLGAVLMVLGVVFVLAPKIPFLGKLPGDIHLRGKNWSFSFPVVTCIVISIVLTLLLNLFSRR